ncbi:MAG: aminotransferase class III-fold pyridoxal phosphate-dependent enzyme, partial [Chitinophagales bacterium]
AKVHMDMFTQNPILGHLTTFGGHPVCCAAGLAASEFIEKNNLVAQSNHKANLIKSLLIHDKIKSIRNQGLFFAIVFESPEINMALNKKLVEAGLLVDWFLFAPDCLRIAPPLTISDEEIIFACNCIMHTLQNF